MMFIDLHTHSTASDGTLTPSELVALAGESGLSALALTDHDTLAGLDEARRAGTEHGVDVVSGVELSVADGTRSIHIVGLFLPDRPGLLAETLASLRERRHDRNRQILEKLRKAGIPIEYETVTALAQGAVGRPHIAQVMVSMGVVRNFKEAFSRYLGNYGQAYVPKEKIDVARGMELLHAEGALVVLAHPYLLGQSGQRLLATVTRYRDLGLDAIEAFYTEHSQAQTLEYLALAKRLDLAVSGGSDFHGRSKPDVALGRGHGNLKIEASVLTALRERLAERLSSTTDRL